MFFGQIYRQAKTLYKRPDNIISFVDHIEFVLHILVCVCVCVCGFLNNPFKIVKRKKKLLNS